MAFALVGGGCGDSKTRITSSKTSAAPTNPQSTTTGTATSTPIHTVGPPSTPPPAGVSPGQHLARGFRLSSAAFHDNGAIPRRYACDGTDTSLPLSWTGVPPGTRELVVVMRDPDAPGGDFVHWAVAGIRPDTSGFPAGSVGGLVIPGRNSFGRLGYRGPCPPPADHPHHYVITVTALGSSSGLRPGFSPDQLTARALGIATLTGTYARR